MIKFQFYSLLENLTVVENVISTALISLAPKKKRKN